MYRPLLSASRLAAADADAGPLLCNARQKAEGGSRMQVTNGVASLGAGGSRGKCETVKSGRACQGKVAGEASEGGEQKVSSSEQVYGERGSSTAEKNKENYEFSRDMHATMVWPPHRPPSPPPDCCCRWPLPSASGASVGSPRS